MARDKHLQPAKVDKEKFILKTVLAVEDYCIVNLLYHIIKSVKTLPKMVEEFHCGIEIKNKSRALSISFVKIHLTTANADNYQEINITFQNYSLSLAQDCDKNEILQLNHFTVPQTVYLGKLCLIVICISLFLAVDGMLKQN